MNEVLNNLDLDLEKLSCMKESLKLIHDYNLSSIDQHDISYMETPHEKMIPLFLEYLTSDYQTFIPFFSYLLPTLLLRMNKEKWKIDKARLVPLEYREEWDQFIQNNEQLLRQWMRFYKSIPRKLNQINNKETPIVPTQPLSLSDISPNIMNIFMDINSARSLIFLPFECTFLYELNEEFEIWNLSATIAALLEV